MIIGHKNGIILEQKVSNNVQIIKGFPTHTVIGGEFAIAKEDEKIAFKTLLGSCVAIMFFDKQNKIKAMNHFLLPKTNSMNNDMKYGLYSVEAMLNEMYKLGAKKHNIQAKIAGGASIFSTSNSMGSIGQRNVEFALDFCNSENFKIVSNHTRGIKSRVILLIDEFSTYIQNVNSNNENNNVIDNEIKLQENITYNSENIIVNKSTNIELF